MPTLQLMLQVVAKTYFSSPLVSSLLFTSLQLLLSPGETNESKATQLHLHHLCFIAPNSVHGLNSPLLSSRSLALPAYLLAIHGAPPTGELWRNRIGSRSGDSPVFRLSATAAATTMTVGSTFIHLTVSVYLHVSPTTTTTAIMTSLTSAATTKTSSSWWR